MKLLCPSLIIFLSIICFCIYAQQPDIRFQRLSSKDGLSGDIVYCILQDKKGFLWIGTHRGLNRYDGYHFTHYNYDPYDTNSLSGNHVECIKEDNDGILWLTTNKGLNSLNTLTGKIKRYELPDARMPSDMEDLCSVNDSILLINTRRAIYKFNKKTESFYPIKTPKSIYEFGTVNRARFTKDNSGRIFIATSSKECLMINWKNATSAWLPLRDSLQLMPYNEEIGTEISQMYFDSYNNAWAFNSKHGSLSTKINYPYTVKNEVADDNLINSFYEEQGKRLWICTNAGLVMYDYIQNVFCRYTQQPGNEESLSSNMITYLTKDRNGTYWIGTFGGGVSYFTINPKFKHIIIDTSANVDKKAVYGLRTLHSGRILVGTFSPEKFLIDKEKNLMALDNPKDSITLDSMIFEITGKSRQSFSNNNYGILHGICQTQSFLDPKNIHAAVKDIPLTGIVVDEKNNVWAPTNGSILLSANTSVDLYHSMAHIVPADSDHLLIATNRGLLLFNKRSYLTEATYLPQRNDPYSISSSFVGGIFPDGKGNYWITTLDAGFNFWNRKENRFYHYTTKDGLVDNTIYGALFDKHGRIWFSTNNGLSCFDTATKTFTNYDRSDGLINSEFNSGSACTDNDGYLYFGGMNGIDYFHPDSFMQIKQTPAVYVSAFKVYNKPQPFLSFYKLATDDNNISVEFTTNDLSKAAKIFYRYKLRGVDKTWVAYQGNNAALYNKLPPGKYHFMVQASYNNKIWSKPLLLDFTIATPWFKMWWFYSLLTMLIGILVYLIFQYRLRQQLKVLQIRNRIHRDLHDDVGATLSSVKAYSEILRENPNNSVIAELITENASEMIEHLEVIAWATNPRHDSFGSLIEKINHYAVPICFAKSIQYDISPDGISKDLIVPGEIRQNVFLVAKEAINNTAKYANANNCIVKSFIVHGKFIMEISDDGNGFDGVNKSGNGLQNMYTRIKEIGGEIFIISEEGKGTKIKIELPFPFNRH